MPENFSTLIVPATIAHEEAFRQLLLYFDRVFLYSPDEEPALALPPEFATLCRYETPAPLGPGLANFRQLIADMTRYRSEYFGGGLSKISQATQVDEESVRQLISRLAPPTSAPDQDGALLQARLLLKLAEIRDQEEREIAEALARIDGQGQALLQGLTSEEDDEGEAELRLALAGSHRPPASDTLEQRLWAWARLFLADPKSADHWLVITTPEVLATIVEITTTHLDEAPSPLLTLPLASAAIMTPTPAAYLQARTAWQQVAAPCLGTMATALKNAARSGTPCPVGSIQDAWNACHKGALPWGEEDGAALDFYLLPVSLADLMTKIAKRPAPTAAGAHLPYSVVAVLNR